MGERFGHYEILRRLAAGGMAEVLLAKHRGMGGFERLVCLKRILPHLSGQEEFLRMFQDEARIAANLVHPNIAQIYDIDTAQEQAYIAMEYVRGEDLRRVYNQEVGAGHAMPKHVAALIIMGAAAGLDYAHRQTGLDGRPLGIVHRDVSPQNILVTYDGHVKLIDFGVAKAAGKLNQTRAGVLKGKYSYMSPEQASGDPIDGRTDIFALGVTLYEITTGTRLFKRDNELETLHAVIACSVRPPRELVPDYDVDLENIVLRALAYDVDGRYTTAGELEHDLERYLLRHGHPTSASSLAGYMQDLFAEKLAEEAVSGGLPDSATSSRRGAHVTSLGAAGTELKEAGTRVGQLDDATVVDGPPGSGVTALPPPVPTPPPPPPPRSDTATPADWRTEPDGPERTASTRSRPAPQEPPTVLGPAPEAPPSAVELERAADAAWVAIGGDASRAPGGRARARALALTALVVVASSAALWARTRRLGPGPAPQAPGAEPSAHAVAPPAVPPADAAAPARAPGAVAPPPPGAVRPAVPGGGWASIVAPVPMAVSLGGHYLGDTPLQDVPLPAGVLRLKLEGRRDGLTLMQTVRVAPGEHVHLAVPERRGVLDVTAVPWAWVQMGQHPARETPARLELLEGEYLVTTECPDGRRSVQKVWVGGSAPTQLVVPCR